MREFHDWVADQENSIEDNSTFSKQMPAKDQLQEIFYRALDTIEGKDVVDEYTAVYFFQAFEKEIAELMAFEEYQAICTDDAYKYWFHRFKQRVFR